MRVHGYPSHTLVVMSRAENVLAWEPWAAGCPPTGAYHGRARAKVSQSFQPNCIEGPKRAIECRRGSEKRARWAEGAKGGMQGWRGQADTDHG